MASELMLYAQSEFSHLCVKPLFRSGGSLHKGQTHLGTGHLCLKLRPQLDTCHCESQPGCWAVQHPGLGWGSHMGAETKPQVIPFLPPESCIPPWWTSQLLQICFKEQQTQPKIKYFKKILHTQKVYPSHCPPSFFSVSFLSIWLCPQEQR